MITTINLGSRLLKKITIFILLLSTISFANASIIALDSIRGTGNQNFNGSLAMHFDVISSINITHLGAFDSSQDGFTSEISVGIFDRNTELLVTEVALFNGTSDTLIGQSRFIDIIDVVLGIGSYSIVAQGFNSSNLNGNSGVNGGGAAPNINTDGGLILFVGGGFYNYTPTLDYTSLIADTGPANRYDAGTFQFEAIVNTPTNIPEPTSLALLGLGLVGFGFARKKKKS